MTTETCKEFLAKNFPEVRNWKRTSKKLDGDAEIRVFVGNTGKPINWDPSTGQIISSNLVEVTLKELAEGLILIENERFF